MSSWKKRIAGQACGAALWLAAGLALPTSAAEGFRPRIASRTDGTAGKITATITVNEEPVAVLKASAGGHGPEVRAQLVAQRLQTLVANGLQPGEINVRRVTGRTWELTARQDILLLVPPEEAAAHRSSSESLARGWANTLRRLLAEPALTMRPAGVTIPYGETRTVKIGGAALASSIVAQDTDVHISQTKFDPATRTLTVHGQATGRDAVNLQAGEVSASIPIAVMKYAAQVSPNVTVSVTGEPSAPADVVTQAIYAGLARATEAEPGTEMRLSPVPKFVHSLASGGHVTAPIPLRITGQDLLPVQTTTTVTVQNHPIDLSLVTALFYSNSPEQVKQGQTLFTGQLEPNKPVRLDYHHQNISGGPLIFHADLINESASPASVHVMSGLSLPGADTVQVGRRAGATFLKALDAGIGIVLEVPPHARVPVVTQRFGAGLTVSGIVQMQQIAGAADSVSLQVAADGDQTALVSSVARVILAALPDSHSAPLPDQPTDYGTGTSLPRPSPYVFRAPHITRAETYSVGGKWAYIRIGNTEALKDVTGKLRLWGNYGADYQITLTLSNPTPQPHPVGIFFAPEAGLSAGVFRVDSGPILEFDPTQPPLEPQIARFTLAPGETRRVQLETIPLNGSSYPLSLIVHAL